MRPAVLLLLACVPSARAAPAADPALVRVVVAEKKLDQKARQHHKAVKDKSLAGREAIAAAQALARSGPKHKEEAKADVLEARRDLRLARREAAATGAAYVGTGRSYIAAEDAYHQATGHYHDQARYDLVRQQLKLPPRPGAPPQPEAAPPPEADDPLIQAINDGLITTPEMERRAEQLSLAGDAAVARALGQPFPGPQEGLAGAGTASDADGAPARGASGGANTPAQAASMDRAILLSSPGGDQAAAASRRYLAAGADRLGAGDARGGLDAAEAALKANPRNAKAWAQKAAALNKLRRWAEAEEAAQRAVRLDPGNSRAYRDLAWAQLHLGKADEAESNATRMIFLDPDNAEGYVLRAFAYELKGDRKRMLGDLERAAALDPKYLNHLARARAGLRLFDPAAANPESLLDALDPLPPAPSNALVRFGAVLLALGALVGAFRAAQARAARRAAPPLTPAPDPLLAGRFRKLGPVGHGDFGEVWEAVDESLDRAVALEELPASAAADPAQRASRLEEARAAGIHPRPDGAELYEVLELPSALVLVWSRAPVPPR
ncbi:MAG: tetratricopeptide repeat protein [Elusimicrobia bacterium]|nr:tetratricopeptide repeat protein [Elusimicrobiota bacterium]